MGRYKSNILGLCEMRWENFGETTTEERHTVFLFGKEDKHKHGIGFLVHKHIVNTVMGCHPISSRLITISLRAVPFNITVVQVHTPTSDYDDNKIEEFHDQLQNVIDQTPNKDILVATTFNDLVLANTFRCHKASRRWTWLAQINNITTRLITL